MVISYIKKDPRLIILKVDVLEILDIKYLLGKPKLNISCLLSWLKINCLNRKIKRATIHSSGKYDFKVKLYSEVYVFDCFTRNLRFSSRWESITNYHKIKSFHRYFISAFVCLYGFFLYNWNYSKKRSNIYID